VIQDWISPALSPGELEHTRDFLGNDPRISLSLQSSQQPNLRIISSVEFVSHACDNAPFITLSPLALWPMNARGIDPLTFRPANQTTCILNLFLLGNMVCFCLIPNRIQNRLQRYVHDMGGIVQTNRDVDFRMSDEPMEVESRALIVRSSWFDALSPGNADVSPQQHAFQVRFDGQLASPERRANMAVILRKEKSYREIEDECHVSSKTNAAIKKSLNSGATLPPTKPRRPPSLMGPEVVSQVRNLTTEDPHFGLSKVAHKIHDVLEMDISRQTICSVGGNSTSVGQRRRIARSSTSYKKRKGSISALVLAMEVSTGPKTSLSRMNLASGCLMTAARCGFSVGYIPSARSIPSQNTTQALWF
jgi:transposase